MGRASVLDPAGEQGQEPLARAGVEAADQLAMGVAPREGASGQGETLDEGGGRNDDPAKLQIVDDGAHDRLAPLGPDRCRGAGRNRDAIVGLPDGAQVEMTDDLACMLPACLVAAGVLVEGAWLDPELLGDDVDDSSG